MAQDDDLVTFIDDEPTQPPDDGRRRWKVVIIDDDEAVHDGTRFALYDYALNGVRLEILSAYSAAEGRALLREHPDTAVVLLDVVMESESAGLELVDYIRKALKNETVRIILRTGQPGQAPERRVIIDYDINDYKAKTELTADKLFTTLTAALRGYQQLQRLVETRRGLEIIIDAASTLFDFKSMQRLAEGVLTQIASLLNVDCAGILVLREGQGMSDRGFAVLAGSGCYQQYIGRQALDAELHTLVDAAFSRRRHEFQAHRSVLYINTASGREVVVLIEAARHLSDTDRSLVEVFCSKLSVAFDNVILYEELQRANAQLEQRVASRTQALTVANERLAAQGERLRRTNAFKGEILGKVAHDLKNPLGVIMGRAEMLKDVVSQTPINAAKAREQIVHVQESGRRLIGMVDTLLADAMADADDINLRREPLAISDLVQRVAESNRELATKKAQTLTVSASAPLTVFADPDRLWEAIDNLVNNAIKYTPSGGTVALAVNRAGDAAEISVRDTGAGLSPEDVARLFGRFQRLSAKPTGGETSTGLGLSIVKRIVELHEGKVAASSAGPGRGSTFTITLPLERDVS
jgi:signal transduction histidine kinase/DNA-binding NarL/FixJ family response regulator